MKVKAILDGKEVEVELKEPPAGFIAEEVHAVKLETETKRSFDRGKRGAKAELLKDEAFRAEALEAWQIDPTKTGGSGKGKPSQDEIVAAQEQWRQKELVPLQKQLDEAKAGNGKILERVLNSELESAAAKAGVLPQFLERDPATGLSPFVAMHKHLFGFDDQTGTHARKAAGEGWEYATKATKERPYLGPSEWVESWAKDERNRGFLGTTTQQVPGANAGGSGSGPKAPGTVPRSSLTDGTVDIDKLAKGEIKVAS